MSIKQSAAILAIFASIALVGGGCVAKDSTSSQTTAPTVLTPSSTASAKTDSAEATETCPKGTVRYAHADDKGRTLSFCHEERTTSGTKIIVKQDGDKTVLYAEDNDQWTHSVTPLWIKGSTNDPAAYIAANYMTAENRAACSVRTFEGEGGSQYVISGGDLDTQENCGAYKTGSFWSTEADPDVLFYVEIGQDTFMPSATWRMTLEGTK